jgi:hypothetical protein
MSGKPRTFFSSEHDWLQARSGGRETVEAAICFI